MQHSNSQTELQGYDVRAQIVKLTPALKAFARTLRLPPSDAEDLVQETVVKALGALHTYQPGTALKSWLFTIERNTFCTMFNKKKREVVGVEPYSDMMVMQPSQEWAIQYQELEDALQKISKERRDAVMMVACGTSYEEVALASRCEIGTVKSRVSRARCELAEILEGVPNPRQQCVLQVVD